jgi:hypothetical protein
MVRSARRLYRYLAWVAASACLVAVACFAVNCLVDPLWYLHGNILTGINYPFNERQAKANRFFADPQGYNCLILGTSRATLMPARDIKGYRCFNFAFSDAQVSEDLLYAKYLRAHGVAPALIIVDVKREDFIGPTQEPVVPDFILSGAAPPSIFTSYLSLDALDFSIRTLRGDAPHHRYYDRKFEAQLEVRSAKHRFKPVLVPMEPPTDVHPERAEQYIMLRHVFPSARAIAYLPPESAWRIAGFNMTGGLDAYLGGIARIAAAYDDLRDFAIPSNLTETLDGTYDGSHYSATVNATVAAALMAYRPDPGIDWHGLEPAAIIDLYHQRLNQFIATASKTKPPSG